MFNTLRPRQNGRHFADDIFKYIFLNENVWIPIKISLKFVPKGRINNIPALVLIIAWRRPGDKPLSETMMVSLPTHICVTRPQWVKNTNFTESVPLRNKKKVSCKHSDCNSGEPFGPRLTTFEYNLKLVMIFLFKFSFKFMIYKIWLKFAISKYFQFTQNWIDDKMLLTPKMRGICKSYFYMGVIYTFHV